MEVHTIQLAKWRQLKDTNIELIDTTVKSGNPAFALNWSMVSQFKEGKLTEEEYSEQYRDLMLRSYFTNSLVWKALLQKEAVAIGCYCQPGRFCHRHLLVKYLEGICGSLKIPFVNKGEFL